MNASTKASAKEGYRPLKPQFQSGGFNYRQIAREKDGAIYEQTRVGIENPSVGYEVVRIRREEATVVFGNSVEPREVYPSSTEWGVHGWTFCDKEKAFARLREIAAM